MKKILFVATLVLSVCFASAQNSKKIIGKWVYSDLHDKSELDEMSQQMAAMLFKDFAISFRPDNSLSISMRKAAETGTYTFDPKDEALMTAVSQTGKSMTLRIVSLSDSEMTLKLDQLGAMIMKKVSEVPDAAPPVIPKVAATKKQVVGKWYVIGSNDKEMSEMAAELMKDSYIEFTADGKYNAEILSIEQNGTWKFGPDNTTIEVGMEDEKGIWSIYAVSDTELEMQNDTSVKRMIFSRIQPNDE